MRILVTGGSGYVGSHAVRELAEAGHEVAIYDDLSTGHRKLSQGFELIEGDIGDTARISKALEGKDAVIHFAGSAYVGESVENPRKYFRNNVESGLKLLDAVLASAVRNFVFSSTCATYGVPRELPISEDSPQIPINPYGATKLFFEHALAAYSVSNGLNYASLRYFNAAGAHPDGTIGEYHNPETHLLPLALKAALGTAPAIKVFGDKLDTADGTCVRDFVHVTDLGTAHVKAVEHLAAGRPSFCANLGTGQGTSIKELLAVVERVSGRPVPHQYVDARPGDPPSLYADCSRAKSILGWSAKFSLEDIVSTAWNWEQKLPDCML
jgi:UDP-glucose-4-epimerase GalE